MAEMSDDIDEAERKAVARLHVYYPLTSVGLTLLIPLLVIINSLIIFEGPRNTSSYFVQVPFYIALLAMIVYGWSRKRSMAGFWVSTDILSEWRLWRIIPFSGPVCIPGIVAVIILRDAPYCSVAPVSRIVEDALRSLDINHFIERGGGGGKESVAFVLADRPIRLAVSVEKDWGGMVVVSMHGGTGEEPEKDARWREIEIAIDRLSIGTGSEGR